jgi:hypothetical protein
VKILFLSLYKEGHSNKDQETKKKSRKKEQNDGGEKK